MKLIYISHMRFPSERTHSTFAMKTCESFARKGIDVELWVPRRRNAAFIGVDPFVYHGIAKLFRIRRFPALDLIRYAGPYGNFILASTFGVCIFFYAVAARLHRSALFYGHDPYDMVLLFLIRARVFVEIHEIYGSYTRYPRFIRWIFSSMAGCITTNRHKKNALRDITGIPDQRIMYVQNAVDVGRFQIELPREEARMRLKLPLHKKIFLYTGHLFDWKGRDTLFEAHRFLNGEEMLYLVGGTQRDSSEFQRRVDQAHAENIVLIGERPHGEIPLWLRAADVLLVPHSGKFDIARFEASPVKLFEYMASGRPIVVSDLPSIREIADGSMVWLCEPDNPKSFVDSIHSALAEKTESEHKAKKAREEVLQYTWEMRSQRIIDFIRSVSGVI